MKNCLSRNVLKTELPRKVGTSSGRYVPIQPKSLYMTNSGISVQTNGRISVISIT